MSKLRIMIDAGHGLYTPGKRCLKSLDRKETREWEINNRNANHLMTLLSGYDCEVARADDVSGKEDVSLSERVAKANNWKADVYISLHQNAGICGKLIGYKGKLAGGTVVFYCGSGEKKRASSLYNEIIAKTGLVGDRAQEVIDNNFYVIRYTSMPAFLIENGFMDSPTDVPIILSEEHSRKTAEGIVNFLVKEFGLSAKQKVSASPKNVISVPELTKPYIYAGVDYRLVFDPIFYSNTYSDLKRVFGTNESQLLKHFVQYGMKEQRQACAWFNVRAYKKRYSDLQRAFGNDMPKYYRHYIQYGYKEKRKAY